MKIARTWKAGRWSRAEVGIKLAAEHARFSQICTSVEYLCMHESYFKDLELLNSGDRPPNEDILELLSYV